MESLILRGLNPSQLQAVTHFKGPCLVLAGPGSGKTLTIAKRIEYLIKVYKVRPEEILVITFTKYASAEMKKRYSALCGPDSAKVTCGTFHGIYYGILKWAYGIDSSNILSEEDKKALLKSIIHKREMADICESLDQEEMFDDILGEIGYLKNHDLNTKDYHSKKFESKVFQKLYYEYEREKNLLRKIDFEDMLVKCKELLTSRPDILSEWQKKFRFILVDEFQDVNQIQYDVIKLLAGDEKNLFVVGDDDQSIYGFRGAKPDIMQSFEADFPNLKNCLLDINYRSDANIVRLSLKVVNNNKIRFHKKIKANNQSRNNIEINEFRNMTEESAFVVEQIKKLTEEGIIPEDIAVLSRTSMDLRALSELLIRNNIIFSMREKMNSIYKHPAILDLLSYLRACCGQGTASDYVRIINKPVRYISRESLRLNDDCLESMKMYYKNQDWMLKRIDQLRHDLGVLKNKTPFAAIEYIKKKIGYEEAVIEAYDHIYDLKEIDELIDEVQERSKDFKTIDAWLAFIEKYENVLEHKNTNEQKGIRLMSIHTAKGLEFDSVFLIRCNEKTIPHKKAIMDVEIEEERRLFYVAMTRAKRILCLSYIKEKNGKEQIPSRFISELLAV